jgi:hypothetical protein
VRDVKDAVDKIFDRVRSSRGNKKEQPASAGEYAAFRAIPLLLRSDFAQSTAGRTPNGAPPGQLVPSDGRATLNAERRIVCCALERSQK